MSLQSSLPPSLTVSSQFTSSTSFKHSVIPANHPVPLYLLQLFIKRVFNHWQITSTSNSWGNVQYIDIAPRLIGASVTLPQVTHVLAQVAVPEASPPSLRFPSTPFRLLSSLFSTTLQILRHLSSQYARVLDYEPNLHGVHDQYLGGLPPVMSLESEGG